MPFVIPVDDSSLGQFLESKGTVLVDFWGPDCGKCKLMAPVLERFAEECGERLKVAAVNVEDSPMAADEHKVISLPTMKVFVDGNVVKTITNALPQRMLMAELAPFLLPA
jgi:thioredoxin 1